MSAHAIIICKGQDEIAAHKLINALAVVYQQTNNSLERLADSSHSRRVVG